MLPANLLHRPAGFDLAAARGSSASPWGGIENLTYPCLLEGAAAGAGTLPGAHGVDQTVGRGTVALKAFHYGSANSGTDRRLGRIVETESPGNSLTG